MKLLLITISLTASALVTALAQSTPPPAFEVASVRPCSVQDQGKLPIGLFTYPGGRISATNYTLKQLIHDAYDLEMYRILSGPSWSDSDRFNVEAKPPETSAASKWVPANFKSAPNPEMRQMLQTLLADRFQLKVHRESKPESVYVLVTAKGGPKLSEPKDSTRQPFVSFGRTGPVTADAISSTLRGQNATIDQLTERLAQVLRRPVENQTGIKGNFDFLIEYAAVDAQSEAAPALVRAIQDQVGLKLETRPGSVEVLVIDHAEKPTAN